MLTIRLQRRGRKNDPSFRVLVVDSKTGPKSGKFVEVVGSFDPHTSATSLKGDRIKYWMSEGATVSDTVHNMLVSHKIIEGKKINVLPKKSAPKKEEPAPAEASAAAAPEAAAPEASAEAVSNDVASDTPTA